ncbi:unnamed protein product [Strongylus vulgaris]|uniref:Reverse transcriptase domain-containing protein n=1 Tax=Strongylus vulgaris TaxID=40348 RepID=A0A3P7KVA8_STRVU|nr:unnamed protein product [Strongylus vulgaris]
MVGTAKAHGSRSIHPMDKNDLSQSHEPSAYRGGTVNTIPHKERQHQGSVLSPLLIITVMDAVTEGIKRQPPWPLLYADDMVLMAENKELEEEAQSWKDQLGSYGLKLNTKKTEFMKVGGQTSGTIYIGSQSRKRVPSST